VIGASIHQRTLLIMAAPNQLRINAINARIALAQARADRIAADFRIAAALHPTVDAELLVARDLTRVMRARIDTVITANPLVAPLLTNVFTEFRTDLDNQGAYLDNVINDTREANRNRAAGAPAAPVVPAAPLIVAPPAPAAGLIMAPPAPPAPPPAAPDVPAAPEDQDPCDQPGALLDAPICVIIVDADAPAARRAAPPGDNNARPAQRRRVENNDAGCGGPGN
jgi:hypothetical protein